MCRCIRIVWSDRNVQVNDHLRVDVPLDAVVSVAYDLLPNVSLADLVAKRPPLLRPKSLLTLVRVEFDNRIQDRKIQTPNLDLG